MSTSAKAIDWVKFSGHVITHIEEYVVPQYGDKHEDECGDYTIEDCIMHIKRYAARYGRNSRPGQDETDLLKIAHYAQMAFTKLQEQNNAKK